MNDLSGLMTAICQDPEDMLARLAYADLCEEVGDIDRATFIRKSIEIDRARRRWGGGFDSCEPCPYLNPTLLTVQAILDKIIGSIESCLTNRTLWMQPVFDVAPIYPYPTFGRGFVEELSFSMVDWMWYGPRYVKVAPLTKIFITSEHENHSYPVIRLVRIPPAIEKRIGPKQFPNRETARAELAEHCLAWARQVAFEVT